MTRFCTSCGTPRGRDGQRFCARCGHALPATTGPGAPVPPPPPSPVAGPPAPAPAPTPALARRPLVALLAVVALAVVAGGGGLLLVAADGDGAAAGGGHARADPPGREERDGRGERDAAGAPSARTAAPTTAATSEPASAFACWDGTSADRLADCGEPTGVQGMTWVFPSAAAQDCSRSSGGGSRLLMVTCEVVASSGAPVRVNYTHWAAWQDAWDDYSSQNVEAAATSWRGFHRWHIRAEADGSPTFKLALLYRDAPWSVTVYGTTPADRDEVARDLRTRRVSDLMGERTD